MNKSDHTARAAHAFFGVEGEIHDLRHMALIAWTLLQDTMKAENRGDHVTLQMSRDELECLEFAVSKTTLMASDLVAAFGKEFETEKKAQ